MQALNGQCSFKGPLLEHELADRIIEDHLARCDGSGWALPDILKLKVFDESLFESVLIEVAIVLFWLRVLQQMRLNTGWLAVIVVFWFDFWV